MSDRNTISSKVAKLIDVKSIVTILLTVIFCYLSIRGGISTEYLTIYTMIISFYFGTQVNKKSGSE